MKGKIGGKSHSWWWDSHNAPKNSKWLEENLNEMDSKVKVMLRLIEEDADSFAKRAEMYYKKRPELLNLVEEFYRAYRSLAERYDQLTGHIRQIPQEIQTQFGFSGDASPSSPGSSGVRKRAAGFDAFANFVTRKPSSKKKDQKEDGSGSSSSSSSSDSEDDSRRNPKPWRSEEIQRLRDENEQLREDLDKGVAHHQTLEIHLAELQEEYKALQHQNGQLHRNAASSHSEIVALEAEMEGLKKENFVLGEEVSIAVTTAGRLQRELEDFQEERSRLTMRLEETGIFMHGLEAKIREHEARILKLTEDLLLSTSSNERLEKELMILGEERNKLLTEVSVQVDRIRELEEEIVRLQASLALAHSQKEKQLELQQSLEKTLADLQTELSSVQDEKEKISGEFQLRVEHVQYLEDHLKETQAALESFERDKGEVAGLLSNKEVALVDLQVDFNSMQGKLNDTISLHAQEKQALEEHVEELKSALAAFHLEKCGGIELRDVLERKSMHLDEELRVVKEALEVSEREKEHLGGPLSKTKSSLSDLQEEFGAVQEKLNMEISLQAEEKQALNLHIEELQAALEALQDQRSRGAELQDVLQGRLTELSQQLEQVQAALERAIEEKAEVGDLLSKAELRFADLQGHFGAMQERWSGNITMHTQEKRSLTEEVEELQGALAALQGDRCRGIELQDVLEKQLMGLQQELSDAKQENASLSEDLNKRIIQLIQENQDLQQERESAIAKCDSLSLEVAEEHDSRITAEEASSKSQTDIEGLGVEIAKLQAELQNFIEENRTLTEAALEQERVDAIEIEALTKVIHSAHEENGSSHISERSLHFNEGKHSTLRRLKDSVLHLLTDRSKIKQEAAAHTEHVRMLKEEIEKAGLQLETSKGDYYSLAGRHESLLEELQALQLLLPRLEGKIHSLEVEKKQLQEQLLSSVKYSDEHTRELLREKELYEKLVSDGEHMLKLQNEIKLVRDEAIVDKRRIDDLNKEIERLLLEIHEIGKAKEEQEKTITQEIQDHIEEKSKLQGELSFKDEQIMKLEEEIALLRAALTEKEQDLIQLQEQKCCLEGRLEAELANVQKLDGSASLWHEERSSLLSFVSLNEQKALDLLEQLGLLTQEKEELLTDLQAKVLASQFQQQEIEKLKELLEDLNSKLAHLEEHSITVSQKYHATLSELEALQMQFSSLQVENGRLGSDVLSSTVSVAELTEVISSFEKKNAELEAELNSKLESALLLEEQLASFQQENDRLKGALNAGTQEMQALEEEISKLRQLHLNLQAENECLAGEKQRSLDEHSLIQGRLQKVEKDFAFHQNENSRLKSEHKYAASRIQDLESTISQLEKEKKAFSIEIASTVLLMNDLQERADGLQEEMNKLRSELMSSNEQVKQKIDEIQELSSLCQALREEKSALSVELENNVHEVGNLESNLCALKDEHLSLADRYTVLSTGSTAGASLVQKLKEEIAQLSAEKEAQDQLTISRIADIRRLQEELLVVQDAEKELRSLLQMKEQTVNQLEEELDRLKAAMYASQREHKQEREKLETELKRLELVVISVSDEKVSLSERHALSVGRCHDLEALCSKLQQQLAEHNADRSTLVARLSLIDELKREVLDDEQMVRVLQERVATKQHDIEQVHTLNKDLKEVVRKFESEVESLRQQIIILQKKNALLNDELSTKATLLQELNQSFTGLKEQKVAFEGGVALAVRNVGLVQAEVNKLLEKIAKLTELSHSTEENLQKTEDRICKLQVSNLNLKDEIAGQATKEKSYVIAVRFMRAEFVCLVQRIRALKEEKAEQARLAELSLEVEKKKNGDVVSSLHQELAFLREENKRQRTIMFDRAEEKREAIRQLCITLDYIQVKNRRLEGVIASTREKIQRRITAT